MTKRGASDKSSGEPSADTPATDSSPNQPSVPLAGDVIDGKYKLLNLLGAGAIGSVFKAEQLHIERQVAVKFLHRHLAADPAVAARFRREGQLACRLRHPNTVLVYEFGFWKDLPYLVMELAEGSSLRELLQTGVQLSPGDTRTMISHVGAALREAHALGIVHRDLKPENISVTKERNGDLTFRVLDFGLAKSNSLAPVAPEGATRYGMFFGTPAYSSPEQATAKEAGPPSDIYSLGIVAYEALTGVPPFHGGSDLELLMKHVKDPVPSLRQAKIPGLSSQFAAFIEACLAKDPAGRFADAGEMLSALEKVDQPRPEPPVIPQFETKHAVTGAVVIALAIAGIWALLPERDKTGVALLDPTPAAAVTAAATAEIISNTPAPDSTEAPPAPTKIVRPEPTAGTSGLWDPTPAPPATPPVLFTAAPLPTYQYLFPTPAQGRGEPPADLKRELNRGMEHFSAGRYSDAIRTLQPVVQADPSQTGAWATIGLSYEHLNYCREAQPALQQAIALDSKQAIFYFYLSRVQAQCRQSSDAIAALKMAVQLDPNLRSRAAQDALFAAISKRPEYRAIVGAPARSVSRFENFVDRVGRSISNLWN